MGQTLGALMRSRNSLSIVQIDLVQTTILGFPIQILGKNTKKVRDKISEVADKIHKAPSSAGYSDKSMKKVSDVLLFNNIINDIGYTGIGDKMENSH